MQTSDAEAADRLPSDFVFRAPTVADMTRLLVQTFDSSTDNLKDVARVSALQAAVSKYTYEFPLRPKSLVKRPNTGDVVLVTGTTGGFGCNILAQLSHDPTVTKVYALNRPSDDTVQRQVHAMQKQGLLEDCLRAPKFEMVEGDLSKHHLGLEEAVYEKVDALPNH